MRGLTGFVPYLCLSPFVDGERKKETFCAVQTRVQARAAKLQDFSRLKNGQREFTRTCVELMAINCNL